MSLGPAEVMPILSMVRNVDSSPVRIAKRFLGLSGAEMEAGIPTWAWVGGALAVGVATGIVLAPKFEAAKSSVEMLAKNASRQPSRRRKVFGRYR